jgi:hypothetical protein
MHAAKLWWFAPWLILEPFLPGAALFGVLLWLSQRFVREGFADVRQHSFAATFGNRSFATHAQRNWWSCTCIDGTCRCLATIERQLRRCCVKAFPPFALPIPAAR